MSIASAGKFLATLNINIKTLNKIHLAADQVREKITEQDIPLFGKNSGKLKSGNDCAHRFHEKCFGKIRESQQKASEVKLQLKGLVKKYQQLYTFNTRANLKTSKRRTKEERKKAKTRRNEKDDRQRRQDPVRHRAYLP